MRISELADRVGVPTSTVRYYERIGLIGAPSRTGSGYRDYDRESATRLLFVARARRLGLSCDQITALLPVWDGTNCAASRVKWTGLDCVDVVMARSLPSRHRISQAGTVLAPGRGGIIRRG